MLGLGGVEERLERLHHVGGDDEHYDEADYCVRVVVSIGYLKIVCGGLTEDCDYLADLDAADARAEREEDEAGGEEDVDVA